MIKQVPFDVYLAATKADENGEPLDAQFVETIMIYVYDNGQHQFLTTEAHIEIDACKIKALYKRGTKEDLDTIKNLIEYKLQTI
jgi:hypothetical protein